MDQSGHRAILFFIQGVFLFAVHTETFLHHRNHGAAQRMRHVHRIKQAGIVRGNGHGTGPRRIGHGASLFLGEPDHQAQGLVIADSVLQLPAPVLPVFPRNTGIETLAEDL
jgi:hypothetical protein